MEDIEHYVMSFDVDITELSFQELFVILHCLCSGKLMEPKGICYSSGCVIDAFCFNQGRNK